MGLVNIYIFENEKLDKIIMTQTELLAELQAVKAQLSKVGTEEDALIAENTALKAQVADLQNQLSTAGNVSPDVEAAVNDIKTGTQALDDKVPDAAPQG